MAGILILAALAGCFALPAYGLYKGLNFLLKKKLFLKLFGFILLVFVISLFLLVAWSSAKEIYLAFIQPEEASLLMLKSYGFTLFLILIFDLSIRSISGQSANCFIESRSRLSKLILTLFFIFTLIGITDTLVIMSDKMNYIDEQKGIFFDIFNFLLNFCFLSSFNLFSIRRLLSNQSSAKI